MTARTTTPQDRQRTAGELMMRFAERTGLMGETPPRRYLWTDAFAVCNFLGLTRATGEGRYQELALELIESVHGVLGRHRPDDPRTGWISGLGEREGQAHPTRRGLRIGKPLPERRPGEPFDERLEWERDGQYFHYLTKWMHALDQVARATGNALFNQWARELAAAAYAGFGAAPVDGSPRLHWKMSIDLSRPLVASMGQHDPLDGYITCLELRATASAFAAQSAPELETEALGFRAMIDDERLATADPLGLGGLLVDACRLEQLERPGAASDPALAADILAAVHVGLRHYLRQPDLRLAASQRLAFRELGLAIGLHAVDVTRSSAVNGVHSRILDSLSRLADLRYQIEAFWQQPANQEVSTWTEHCDINEVMLATSLVPEGFLVLSGIRTCDDEPERQRPKG